MAEQQNAQSRWKEMLLGLSTVMARRMLVTVLTVLSLAAWAVTVIGMGIWRGESVPRSAEASGVAPHVVAKVDAASPEAAPVTPATQAPPDVSHETAPAAPEAVPAEAAGADAAAGPVAARDPFAASEAFFPLVAVAKREGADAFAGTGQQAGGEAGAAAGQSLVPLRLDGTMKIGRSMVAIVVGNSFAGPDGRTMALDFGSTAAGSGGDIVAVQAGETRQQLKVGDVMTARGVVQGASGFELGEAASSVSVRKITEQSLVLGFSGGRQLVLTLGQARHDWETGR